MRVIGIRCTPFCSGELYMLDYYIRNRKRLDAMERNLLSPYLKKAAAYYRADEYTYTYARRMLVIATHFGEWLRTRRVPLNRITDQHAVNFLHEFCRKFTSRRRFVLAAVNFMLVLIPRQIQPSAARRLHGRLPPPGTHHRRRSHRGSTVSHGSGLARRQP